jgi:hypothetical protein
MASPISTLVVAVDVGMTCTGNDEPQPSFRTNIVEGVAFAIKNEGMEMPEPHTLQSWPGNSGGSSDKVGRILPSDRPVLD